VRLSVIERGLRLRARIALWILRVFAGTEDAVAKTVLYRPGFFGRAFLHLGQEVMRGPSEWTPGERELLATFVSQINSCPFCVSIHSGLTILTFDRPVSAEQLTNWRSLGFEPRIAAALGLLEKLTLTPCNVDAEDLEALRAAGLSETAIVDALHICFFFNLINRLANALDFKWGSSADALNGARFLNMTGYRIPEFLLR
jgi:uncharacterized peroxidase-related enzyme